MQEGAAAADLTSAVNGSERQRPGEAPHVGVVVLNYNGGDLTLECLRCVLRTDWPREALEVVLVDNASEDGVVERTRRELPGVTVVDAGTNLGFAGGCNLGIRMLGHADYVVLLNNDATVSPGWLRPLVEALEADRTVGAVCPKILFADRFVEVSISSAVSRRGFGDGRALGVKVSAGRVDGSDATSRMQLVRGFWGIEHEPGAGSFQWTNGDAILRVPVRPDGSLPSCELQLSADSDRQVTLTSGPHRTECRVGPTPAWCQVTLGGEPFDVINNVGSVLVDGCFGADRGFMERDEGQYDRTEEVFAWCGAAVVLSRRYLDTVGHFDDRYFLYYEDLDLSWRGRAQGWRYLYVPGPPIRHVHSASTVSGSRLHHHYSERNRLLTLTRNAPAGVALEACLRHLLVTASYARRDVLFTVAHRQPPSWETIWRRSSAFASFAALLPGALADRRRLRRRQQVSDAELFADLDGNGAGDEHEHVLTQRTRGATGARRRRS